jgi:predicted lysophospholipase L1 biosynthesis ABC-type transport system permease subunit
MRTGDAPVLISAALANRLFPGKDPIGQLIRRTGDSAWNRVAAVVGDVPRTAIGGEPLEAMYVPVLERAVDSGMNPGHLTLVVRTSGEPLSLVSAVRNIVHSLDRDLALARVQTLERIVGDSMARTTLAMILLLTAGVAALLLGVLGIYAVLAYTVSRRTRELGVRMALGARAADVYALVLRQSGRYVGGGVFIGLLVVLIGARLLRSLLYGVAPLDLTTMAGAVALVCVSSLAASSLPARRAARVDPIRALKVE